MKLHPLSACVVALLAACQVTPNTSDTSNATLRFRVHYLTPGLTTPKVEIVTSSSIEAGQCLYVATPFGVVANAADSGGIQTILIGPSQYFAALKVRQLAGDTVAIPSPGTNTQGSGADTFANPGSPAMSSVVQVSYEASKAFDTVTLMATYEFAEGANLAAVRGTAYNFGTAGGVAEVYNFYVRPATMQASQQPGMSCALP